MKEYIIYEDGNKHNWICLCGNRAESSGFFACNEQGDEIEPTIGSNWRGLFVCAACGRIINNDTGEIVGRNKDFKLLP